LKAFITTGAIPKKMLEAASRQSNIGIGGQKFAKIHTLLERQENNKDRYSETQHGQNYSPLDRTAINRRLAQVEMRVENRVRIRQQSPHNENTTREALSHTMNVYWEIFPPGTVDEVVRFFSEGMIGAKGTRRITSTEKILRERVEAFVALRPEAYIRGRDQLNQYIGAKIAENVVVFENWHYGNALYVLREDWEEISKRSRIELLHDAEARFERIIHSPGWQRRLEETIRGERT
jgi:hypothetical protein